MPKVTGKITVSSRVKEYPTIFYEDDGLLFCKFCCHSVDLKSSTVKDYLQNISHKNKREVQETTPAPVLKQVTLTTVQKSQESRSKFVTGFVKMCLASNILLEKVAIGKMTPWIKTINPQGGALSSIDNLRTYYIPKVAEEVHGAVSVFTRFTILLRIFRRYFKQEEPRFSFRRKSRPYYPKPI